VRKHGRRNVKSQRAAVERKITAPETRLQRTRAVSPPVRNPAIAMSSHTYRFCFGPWNLSEGADPYGPTTRPPQAFDWKLTQLKALGFDAMMFHDDDAVPEIDSKSEHAIREEAKELKRRLDGEGMLAEMVAPRLWFAPQTIDGAYTSNDPAARQYAIDRSLRSIDLANILGTDILVLWLAREGTYLRESKIASRSYDYLVAAFDKMLAHDPKIRLAIEPKPNEPMDHAYVPTIGHALAIAQLTRDPSQGGCGDRKRTRHSRRARSFGRDRICAALQEALVVAPERSERAEVRSGQAVWQHQSTERI
jgi:sugar phosphate isomerase/epimerase